MLDTLDVLLHQYAEQREQARHTENQRATLTNLVLVLASLGIGLVTGLGVSRATLPVAMALVLLGAFGILATAKYRERFSFHTMQARAIMDRIAEQYPEIWTTTDRRSFSTSHASSHLLYRLRTYVVWLLLHALIAGTGISLTVAALA